MSKKRYQIISGMVLLGIFAGIATLAFLLGEFTLKNVAIQEQIASFGYAGIIGLATIAGLNVIVPIPAATFTPVFTAAGLWFPGIIMALAVGTLLADFIGYTFGKISRQTITTKYPSIVRRFTTLYATKRHWVIPVVLLYASFIPFPNEAMVIPLAILGMSWRLLFIPLLIGNLINQTIYAYGFQNVFWFIF